MPPFRRSTGPVLAALDEVRFGAGNILNLREARPTAADARARTEAWLRERQVARAGEVLVITGRGNGSPGGIGIVRAAIATHCAVLKRRGVVAEVREHSPGSFAITLAPVTALVEAPARARHALGERRPDPSALAGLSEATRGALRALARRSLEELGMQSTEASLVEGEMLRLFARLAPSAASEAELQRAVAAAHDEIDTR